MLKSIIARHGEVPPPIHDLRKLAAMTGLAFTEDKKTSLKEITTFNIEARYEDYKRSFYKKATRIYAQKWGKICEDFIPMAQTTRLTRDTMREVHMFAQQLTEAGIRYHSLILFGSRVKGTQKSWSDVDVCVVSSEFGRNRFVDRLRLMKLTDDDTINIEPHPLSPEELADPWDPLAAEIRKYGILL